MSLTTSARRAGALAAALAFAASLTACSSNASSASSDRQEAPVARAVSGADQAPLAAPAAGELAGEAGSPIATAPGSILVRRADVALVVTDVQATTAQVRALASKAGGAVISEDFTKGSSAEANMTGTITIEVPAESLDTALSDLEGLGEVTWRSTSAQDVKGQYVDLEARIASLQTSVERMRALMAQATNVADIIAIEAELSRRQADLDSLQAQFSALKGEVAMSPISIRLATDRSALGVDGGGFVGGLKAGWSALIASVNALLVLAGALVPFVVVLGVIAAPLVWWLRRRRASRPAKPTTLLTATQASALTAPAGHPDTTNAPDPAAEPAAERASD